jgi:hypothetical protein
LPQKSLARLFAKLLSIGYLGYGGGPCKR